MTKKFKQFVVFFIFTMSLFGCQTQSPVEVVSTSVTQVTQLSDQGQVGTPTSQPSPTQTIVIDTTTPTPTLTPSSTSTSTPTLTTTPTSTVALTASSTPLSDEERVALIESWLISPPCPLPCWWGYQPGTDSWTEIEPVYEQMGARIHAPENSVLRQVVFRDMLTTSNYVSVMYIIENDQKVEEIQIFLDSTRLYSLNHILTEYGVPDDVWISAIFGTSSGDSIFRFVLAYWELGFAVKYEDYIGNDEFQSWTSVGTGCIEQPTPISLILWNPAQTDANLAYLFNSGFIESGHPYKHIEEATDTSTKLFFEEFVNTSELACISTPIDLWE